MFYSQDEHAAIMGGEVPYGPSELGPTIFLIIPLLITTLLGLVIVVVYYKSKALWNTSFLCLMNLIYTSMFGDIVRLPWVMSNVVYGRWSVGYEGCTISGFMSSLCIAEMCFSLALISGERYLAIVRQTPVSKRNAKLAILGSWFSSIASATMPFWFGGNMVLQPSGWYCSIDWISTKVESIVMSLAALLWIDGMVFIMGYGYWEIYKKIRANTQRLGNAVGDGETSGKATGDACGGAGTKGQQLAYLKAREIQGVIAMKSARIVGLSLCCWTPVSLVLLAEVITRRPPPKWLDSLGALMTCMNGVVNTTAFLLVDRRFLDALQELTGWAWLTTPLSRTLSGTVDRFFELSAWLAEKSHSLLKSLASSRTLVVKSAV